MQKLISASIFVLSTMFVATVNAQSVCSDNWAVSVSETDHSLNLKITEVKTSGPACDLVIQSFDYIVGIQTMSMNIVETNFCPMDAIAHRQARMSWALPHGLRAGGKLKVVINGLGVGTVQINSDTVSFEGGCQ